MPKVITLPEFKKIRDVRVDADSKTIAIIFESRNDEYFQVVFSSDVVPALIPVLLEKTPQNPSFEGAESFISPIKRFRSGVLEGGEPTLGIFFPSGIPVSILLDNQLISSMIFALKELQQITNGKLNEKPKH